MARKDLKACVPCRDRKRKCDRSKPSCSLCFRLGRVCHYGGLSSSTSSSSSPSSPPSSLTVVRSRPPRISSPKFPIPAIFNDSKLLLSNINNTITEQLSKAIGNVVDVRDVATTYFGTIHLWFPIISETSYYERLPNTFERPRAVFGLLSLSMALINSIPAAKDKPDTLSPLYALLKTSIAMIEAANINTLDVIRARLLVSLFEVGHGIPAAYMSLAATARAAAMIRINQTINDISSSQREEGLRVWWGIVMLDRYYTLERGDGGPCATQDLGSPHHLPKDDNLWDPEFLSSNDPLPLSTPSTIRVGPFARQAQVSHVLNLLLLHLKDQKAKQAFDVQESDQLARTFLSFSRLLPEETPRPWPRYCGAIGMCYGGLMVLHGSREKFCTIPGYYSTEFLQASLEGVAWIAKRFNQKIHQVDIDAVSPFPPHSVYLAALQQDRVWRETGDLRCFEAANSLASMLGHFGRRWLIARKFLEDLEAHRSKADAFTFEL